MRTRRAVGGGILLLGIAAACDARDPARRLGDALGDTRAVIPRWSAQIPHSPCPASPTGEALVLCPDTALRASLARWIPLATEVEEQARADPSPEALRALATLTVVSRAPDTAALEQAAERLRLARALRPGDPHVLNDLAVVLLLRSRSGGDGWDAAEALALLVAALEADPEHPAARFNRALALERLGLVNEALDAWETAAEMGDSRAWRTEGRDRAARLDASLTATRAETTPADRLLQALVDSTAEDPRAAATLLAERGERGTQRILDALDASDSEEHAALADALAAYSRALDLWRAGAFQEAARAYAEVEFRLAGVPGFAAEGLRLRASIGIARFLVYDGRASEAEARFLDVIENAPADTDAETLAHALYGMGLSRARGGDYPAARDWLARSVALFAELGQPEGFGTARGVLAEILGYTGSTSRALDGSLAALRVFGRDGGTAHQNLLSYTGRLVGSVHPAAGVAFHREALTLSGLRGNPQYGVEARIRLAQSEARAGDTARAARLLDGARAALPSIRDLAMRRRVAAEYDEIVGMHLPGLAPSVRDSLLTSAIGYFRETTPAKLPALLERRGRHHASHDRPAEARADLREALAAVERQLVDLTDPIRRADLLQARAAAINALVEASLAAGDTVAALLDLDRPRAATSTRTRDLWDRHTVADLRAGLGEGTAALAYGVLDDRVVAWVIRRSAIQLVSLPLAPDELTSAADRLRYELRSGAGRTRVGELGAWLHERLVAPLASGLTGIEELVLVPDGALHGIPFAVLGPAPGAILERFALRHAPSVAFLLEPEGPRASAGREVLAVSAAEWDRARYPWLAPLSAAEAEARAVAASYPEGRAAQLDAETLADALPTTRILHFAGHAIVRPDRPDLSELVLPGPGGGLSAARIATLDLARVDLVVLAACNTQQASGPRFGGLSGLTWSFLDAGARGVVGSLWAVVDSATIGLMVEVHQGIAGGQTPAEALRDAQVGRAREGRADWGWAAFRYEGR